ncbi:hypothetical protein HUU05_18440 [candidate division KSB1 bacterium]|nr:hypothetical protein [candidate division KSB1 bacterium]
MQFRIFHFPAFYTLCHLRYTSAHLLVEYSSRFFCLAIFARRLHISSIAQENSSGDMALGFSVRSNLSGSFSQPGYGFTGGATCAFKPASGVERF